MTDNTYSAFMQLLKDDPRFRIEAYQFVREALSFGQNVDSDEEEESESDMDELSELDEAHLLDELDDDEEWQEEQEHHLTGQILCEAIRVYAQQQYGYMAKTVLNSWGLTCTGDFGEIVYNLIEIGMMKKSNTDRREDFNDVYDFESAFVQNFRFEVPEETQRP
ncbi:MAG: Minf_1886 family protein [Pirellulales bacterium]